MTSRAGDDAIKASASSAAAADEMSTGARLREIRLRRQLSLTELARQAGVSKGFVSQLERGLTRASVPTLLRICEVLQIEVGDLFTYPDETVIEGGGLADMGGHGLAEYLLTPAECTGFQVFRSVMEPGGGTGGPYTISATSVFALGVRGTSRIIVAGEPRVLSVGMSTWFNGHAAHQFDNVGPTVSELLFVLSPPFLGMPRRPS